MHCLWIRVERTSFPREEAAPIHGSRRKLAAHCGRGTCTHTRWIHVSMSGASGACSLGLRVWRATASSTICTRCMRVRSPTLPTHRNNAVSERLKLNPQHTRNLHQTLFECSCFREPVYNGLVDGEVQTRQDETDHRTKIEARDGQTDRPR